MTDIVERLRWRAENTSTPTATTPMLCSDAAAEITRLRAAIKQAIRQHEEGNRGLAHRTLCEAVYGEQA